MEFPNVYSLFREQTATYGSRPVFYTREGGGWRPRSWNEFEDSVHDLACGLLSNGLTKGAGVAILAGNVPEWTIADAGAIAAGGVGVGLYPTSSAEQCEYIINHSDSEFVIVDTEAQLAKVLSANCPNVKRIYVIDPIEIPHSDVRVAPLSDLLAAGRGARDEFMPRVEHYGFNAPSDATAIMVYTSGTTGKPKGAMLSHSYILNSVESLRRSVPIFHEDVCLSYLPGCHVAERISGIYNRLYNGTAAHFVDDLSRLYEYMLDVRPTVFASLPRFFEKIHAKVVSETGLTTPDPQAVKDAFGGRIRLLTSGGAPLPRGVAQFFADAGVPILQAYGLTENICVAFNRADDLKFGTVGKAMPMCEIRIAGDGEILVKSPMMFTGYYKDPQATAEMFDEDGWLKTGDLGALDEDGFLTITGRKKEMIVLSSGKNVAPALVENLVKASHLISQCFVYGDGRSYCVALITINENEAANMCHEEIQGMVEQAVAQANARVSSSEQIKRFTILDRDFLAENDEVTPTMKLKRDVVERHFKKVLERLYEDQY